jgi:hypothetical protein
LAVEEVGLAAAALVLNACHERRFTEAQEAEILRLAAEGAEGRLGRGVRLSAALAAARRHVRRRKLTRFYQSRLRRLLPLPLVCLPFVFDEELGPASLRLLVERLEAA